MADFKFGILSLKIARILVAEEDRGHWTYDIAKRTAANRGNAHHILRQFEHEGWLNTRTEPGDRKKTVRVLYDLTKQGISDLRSALEPFQVVPMST